MAGGACLYDLYKQSVVIAISVYGNDLLQMTACGALIPKLLPAS